MQKNSRYQKIIGFPIVYIGTALFITIVSLFFNEWIATEPKKIVLSATFLGGLYLLFYFAFLFLQKKYRGISAFIFLIILMLKFGFIIGFLFLFLNPTNAENKRVILLFFMTYFILLVEDVAIKIKLMK